MPGPYDYEPPNYWLVDKEAGGAYGFNTETSPGFGTKKSCQLVHVQYSYDDNSVAVVNGKYDPLSGIKVFAKIYNLDGSERYTHGVTLRCKGL